VYSRRRMSGKHRGRKRPPRAPTTWEEGIDYDAPPKGKQHMRWKRQKEERPLRRKHDGNSSAAGRLSYLGTGKRSNVPTSQELAGKPKSPQHQGGEEILPLKRGFRNVEPEREKAGEKNRRAETWRCAGRKAKSLCSKRTITVCQGGVRVPVKEEKKKGAGDQFGMVQAESILGARQEGGRRRLPGVKGKGRSTPSQRGKRPENVGGGQTPKNNEKEGRYGRTLLRHTTLGKKTK